MRPFEYCRPILAKAVPTEADWIHEVKYDGYRGRVVLSGNEVKVPSKSGLSAKREFSGMGRRLSAIPPGRLGRRKLGDQVDRAKSPDFRACEAQVVNSRKLQDWVAGVAGIELANSNSGIVITVEGDGFETRCLIAFEKLSKSDAVPLAMVQRLRRKMRSPPLLQGKEERRRILRCKKASKISGIFVRSSLRSTTSEIWLAERE